MRILSRGRGELKRSAHDRIRATDPHRSHLHEHLGDDLVPRGEAPHNRHTRLLHTAVSRTSKGIGKIIATVRQRRREVIGKTST
jgi:hypothetical protein